MKIYLDHQHFGPLIEKMTYYMPLLKIYIHNDFIQNTIYTVKENHKQQINLYDVSNGINV